jgi:uncharacterized protein YkwD
VTRFVRRATTLAAIAGALLGASLMSATTANAATTTDASLEARVVTLTNQERAKVGCVALKTDSRLTTAARTHSADMAKYNYFSHTGRDGSTFVDRAKRAGYNYAIGENIAWGYRTADEVMKAWMNSDVHKRNILNCSAKKIGVGLARKADGTPYWTQLFGSV